MIYYSVIIPILILLYTPIKIESDIIHANSRRLLTSSHFTTDSENIITTGADDVRCVFAIDIDGDEDIDILVASNRDDTVSWWENNGSESFTEHVITSNADQARSVFAIDLDGDGDIDVLVASNRDDTVSWWENNGSESFTEHIISDNAGGVRYVTAVDIDGDGNIDVLTAAFTDDTFSW